MSETYIDGTYDSESMFVGRVNGQNGLDTLQLLIRKCPHERVLGGLLTQEKMATTQN